MPLTLKDIAICSPVVICVLIGMLVEHRKQLRAKLFGKKTEGTTTENTVDLERLQDCEDLQPTPEDGFTLTDVHGNQYLPPPPAYQPPASTHRLPGDCNMSFLDAKPAVVMPSLKMGDAMMKHEGDEKMGVGL